MEPNTFLEIQERNLQLKESTNMLYALGSRHESISDFLLMQAQINGVYNSLILIASDPILLQDPKTLDLLSLKRLKQVFSDVDSSIKVFKKFDLDSSKNLIDRLAGLRNLDTFLGEKVHEDMIESFRVIHQDLANKSEHIEKLFLELSLLHKSESYLDDLIAERVWRENAEVQEFIFQCQRDLVRDAIDSSYGITLMNLHYADIFIDLKKRTPERSHVGFPLVLDQMMFSMQWRAIMYSLIFDKIQQKISRFSLLNREALQRLDLAFHEFSEKVFKPNLIKEAELFLSTELAYRKGQNITVPQNYFTQKHAFFVSLIKDEFFEQEDRSDLFQKTKKLLTFSLSDFFEVAEKEGTGNFHDEIQYLKNSGIYDKLKEYLL